MNAQTKQLFYPAIALALLLFAGCGPTLDDSSSERPTKSEIAERAAEGKADHNNSVDWCDELGWYGDGICDTFCVDPDPDCADSDYAPCEGLTCGESCTLCAPGDPDCFETAVVKQCQPDGTCAATTAQCGGDDGDDGDDSDDGDSSEPCGGLACGATCTLCDPNDPDCYETAVVKQCQPDGTCAATVPECDGDDDGGDDTYEPCGDKVCGEECRLCDPNDPDCFETAVVKVCQPDGTCDASVPQCGGDDDGDDTYDPCEGKMCGDSCSLCDPNDPDCFETAVIKQCTADGECTSNLPVCQ